MLPFTAQFKLPVFSLFHWFHFLSFEFGLPGPGLADCFGFESLASDSGNSESVDSFNFLSLEFGLRGPELPGSFHCTSFTNSLPVQLFPSVCESLPP
jgi:hypothetical protein